MRAAGGGLSHSPNGSAEPTPGVFGKIPSRHHARCLDPKAHALGHRCPRTGNEKRRHYKSHLLHVFSQLANGAQNMITVVIEMQSTSPVVRFLSVAFRFRKQR